MVGEVELGVDVWVSAKALGRRLGRRTFESPRREQDGNGGRAERQKAWVPDVKRGLKGLPSPFWLGFPFLTIERGGAVPNYKTELKVRVCK